jgi:hypothetical protein
MPLVAFEPTISAGERLQTYALERAATGPRNNTPIYIQQDATLHILFISRSCCTCFGWYHHPLSETHTTVSTASGICQAVTATCRYRGRVGTGLSVHSTLKPVPTLFIRPPSGRKL